MIFIQERSLRPWSFKLGSWILTEFCQNAVLALSLNIFKYVALFLLVSSAKSLPTSGTSTQISEAFPGHICPYSGQGDTLANLCARAKLRFHQLGKILLTDRKGPVSITSNFFFPFSQSHFYWIKSQESKWAWLAPG